MSDQIIATQASCTLANLKCGSLFSTTIEEGENIYKTLRTLNKRFKDKGIRVIPLRIAMNRVLVYLYRPDQLQRELDNEEIYAFLQSYGYKNQNEVEAVSHLAQRVKTSSEFPHEIGLFLGYPLEDVMGFINKKSESKLIGYWRVYGDVEQAEKKFKMYRKCIDTYTANLKRNISLEEMTICTGGN